VHVVSKLVLGRQTWSIIIPDLVDTSTAFVLQHHKRYG